MKKYIVPLSEDEAFYGYKGVAVELIQCKDCKHITHTPHKWYCPINKKVVERDEFCCWAERRTNETD